MFQGFHGYCDLGDVENAMFQGVGRNNELIFCLMAEFGVV
jgi:hypothetical protein